MPNANENGLPYRPIRFLRRPRSCSPPSRPSDACRCCSELGEVDHAFAGHGQGRVVGHSTDALAIELRIPGLQGDEGVARGEVDPNIAGENLIVLVKRPHRRIWARSVNGRAGAQRQSQKQSRSRTHGPPPTREYNHALSRWLCSPPSKKAHRIDIDSDAHAARYL